MSNLLKLLKAELKQYINLEKVSKLSSKQKVRVKEIVLRIHELTHE